MTVRTLYTLAAAVGIGLAGFSYADTVEPKTAETEADAGNQQLADAVKAHLLKSGLVKGASFSVETDNGIVSLAGHVQSDKQAQMIVREVRKVAGVSKVDAQLEVGGGAIQKVAADEAAAPEPTLAGLHGHGAPIIAAEPMPLAGPGGAQPAYDQTGPKLPAYAWPTYAPYNNLSRVAYPQAYPYNAFPFIGPFYPFPKVPLGWRSVKLEWDDGHWYLGQLSTPHDYWRVRFW